MLQLVIRGPPYLHKPFRFQFLYFFPHFFIFIDFKKSNSIYQASSGQYCAIQIVPLVVMKDFMSTSVKVALMDGFIGETATYTYAELYQRTCS